MNEKAYFFDSYAIIEVLRAGENYRQYFDAYVITTKLNLFEVAHALTKNGAFKEAEIMLDQYHAALVDFNKQVIKEAVLLKIEYKKRKLSMADCIGYVTAKHLQVRFLTGDNGFRDMENVEFVK